MMRLRRLDLTRYGKFTGHSLDFGERPVDAPDLHIVYGPNEAGKSTALSGYLDLLFGIAPQSRYNFLHPYPTMRIGAALELAGGCHEYVRIKRQQRSLLDGRDQPVSDGAIVGELAGVDRETYRTMFSLDDETLEAGGDSILASKGDLGQLLFSASAGLADLSRTLAGLAAEADAFHRPGSRSGELSRLKQELARLKAAREQVDILASDYARLAETRTRAKAQYKAAASERAALQGRAEEIQRLLSALPRLIALRGFRGALHPLVALPDAPQGWQLELPALQVQQTALTVRTEAVESEIDQLVTMLEAVVLDEAALAVAPRLDQLAPLRARSIAADHDFPACRQQSQDAESAVRACLARLARGGEAQPARLLLDASLEGELRELIESWSRVQAAAETAAGELAQARIRLDESADRLCWAGEGAAGFPERGDRLQDLLALVASLREAGHAARLQHAERAHARARDQLGDRLAVLAPWPEPSGQGGPEQQLAALTMPAPDDVQNWRNGIAEAANQAGRCRQEIDRLETQQHRLIAERAATGDAAGAVDDREAARIRAAREAAWATHRRALDAASADAFEAALRHDDIVTNGRLRREADGARLQQLDRSLAVLDADLARARASLAKALNLEAGWQAEVAAAIGAITPPLPDAMSLAGFEAWLACAARAREALASLKLAERERNEAAADCERARSRLAESLNELGVRHAEDADFVALLETAQAAIDKAAQLKSLRAEAEDRGRALRLRQGAFDAASDQREHWAQAWALACSDCWLAELGAPPTVAAVREILPVLGDLRLLLEKRTGLEARVRDMESDRAAFAAQLEAIACALDIDPSGHPVMALLARIDKRVGEARALGQARDAKLGALEKARLRQRELAEESAIHARRAGALTGHFGVATLAEAAEKLRDCERKAVLQRNADDAARDILGALRLASIEDAQALLESADQAALEAELIQTRIRLDDQDQHLRDLYAAYRNAEDRLDSMDGDDAVARIEETRRTVLLEIEEQASIHIRLRAGILAAERALSAYRERHRSFMMQSASEAFRTISREAYSGLATQPGKDGDILIATAADGSTKVASDLSKGTRFQLYLALRVAGYKEFAQSRRTMPFVADDIMETFDDFRAEETFRLFGDMARFGQVIYLTHHRHLCDIAQRAAPGARMHRLAS